jgi:hypothetical protein
MEMMRYCSLRLPNLPLEPGHFLCIIKFNVVKVLRSANPGAFLQGASKIPDGFFFNLKNQRACYIPLSY